MEQAFRLLQQPQWLPMWPQAPSDSRSWCQLPCVVYVATLEGLPVTDTHSKCIQLISQLVISQVCTIMHSVLCCNACKLDVAKRMQEVTQAQLAAHKIQSESTEQMLTAI